LFDRYDQALDAKMATMVGVASPSRPILRTPVIIAALCFFAVLVCFALIEPGLPRIFCAILAGVLVSNCLTRLKLEHSIVQSHSESLGTVSNHKRLGIKRGAVIDYSFLSADSKTHFGTVHGDTALPHKGQTFVVVYSLAEPSLSLPLFSFWFYRFAFEVPETDAQSSL
jgi:hypothetical protein